METINYKNYEWYILQENDTELKLFKKDCIENFECEFDDIDEKIKEFAKELGDIKEIHAPTVQEVIDIDIDVLKSDNWYWTSSKVKGYSKYAFLLYSAGTLHTHYYVNNSIGVRPIITISKDELKSKDEKIEKLIITQEKNIKNNWKWALNGKEHKYNISTPQKIIIDKLNEVIEKVMNDK